MKGAVTKTRMLHTNLRHCEVPANLRFYHLALNLLKTKYYLNAPLSNALPLFPRTRLPEGKLRKANVGRGVKAGIIHPFKPLKHEFLLINIYKFSS
jgi:hypothetical protein